MFHPRYIILNLRARAGGICFAEARCWWIPTSGCFTPDPGPCAPGPRTPRGRGGGESGSGWILSVISRIGGRRSFDAREDLKKKKEKKGTCTYRSKIYEHPLDCPSILVGEQRRPELTQLRVRGGWVGWSLCDSCTPRV